jgi:uncharacterized protein (UPF0548 family)
MTSTASEVQAPTHVTHRIGPRRVVSAVWLFAILSYAYCDILGSHDADYMRGILDGTGPVQLTQTALLGASVLMTIPIAAVLISRVAAHRFARWYSVVAAILMTLVQLASLTVGDTTMYYLYFSVLEIAATSFIAWYAITKWKVDA